MNVQKINKRIKYIFLLKKLLSVVIFIFLMTSALGIAYLYYAVNDSIFVAIDLITILIVIIT